MKTTNLILAAGALVCLTGCGDDGSNSGDENNAGGKADDVDDLDPSEFACRTQFRDASQRSDKGIVSAIQRLDSLNDPFARNLLKATTNGCVLELNKMVEKLQVTEPGCKNRSALVSERGQYLNEDGSFRIENPGFRVVTARGCSGENARPDWHFFFSMFGADNTRLPQSGEAMAFDKDAGVFNYYVFGKNSVEWHGNSRDAVEGGNRCGNCHDQGAPIIKEDDSPWVHWEHFDDISGSEQFFTQFAKQKSGDAEIELLGSRGSLDGASLETLVGQATREYAKSGYVSMFLGEKENQAMNVKALLQPLFCTMEINLQSGGTTFGSDFFLAQEFSDFSARVNLSQDEYAGMVKRGGQTVTGVQGVDDTKRTLTYPERSIASQTIGNELKSRKIVDDDLIHDILMVDFTKPLWSDARCALLDEAVANGAFQRFSKPEDVTADAIREELIATLQASEADGATRLVTALEDKEDSAAHKERRTAYVAACNARKAAEGDVFLDELMLVLSNKRNLAAKKEGHDSRGPHNIIEDPSTMIATDPLDSAGAFFNEQCCIGECAGGAPGEDPPAEDPPAEDPPAEDPPAEDPPGEEVPNLCADRCDADGKGGFMEGAECQCDAGCTGFGDCCANENTVLCQE